MDVVAGTSSSSSSSWGGNGVTTVTGTSSLSSASARDRDMVVRAYNDLSSIELLVGDSGGVVSRWCTARMDQLPADEAAALAFEHAAYSLAAVAAQASERAARNTSQLTF